MATRRKAQLIRAQAGSAAPLVHASVGPTAPLISAQAHIVSGNAPTGRDYRRNRGWSVAGPITSPGGFKEKRDPNAPAPVANNGMKAFEWNPVRGGKNKLGVLKDARGNVIRQFTPGELDWIAKRGAAGASLNNEQLQVYRAMTGWKSEEEKAADLAAAKRKQQLNDAALKRQQELEDAETRRRQGLEDAALKRRQELEDAETKRRQQIEDRDIKINSAEKIAQGRNDARIAGKQMELDAKQAREDAWNERYGIPAGTVLTDREKQDVMYGRKVWGIDKEAKSQIQKARDDLEAKRQAGTVSDADYAALKEQIDKEESSAHHSLVANPDGPTVAQRLAEAKANNGYYYNEGTGTMERLQGYNDDEKSALAEAQKRDALEKERRSYILGQVNAARKDWDSRDPDAEGYDPNAVFDPGEAIRTATENWDSVVNPVREPQVTPATTTPVFDETRYPNSTAAANGGSAPAANPQSAAPTQDPAKDDNPYGKWM